MCESSDRIWIHLNCMNENQNLVKAGNVLPPIWRRALIHSEGCSRIQWIQNLWVYWAQWGFINYLIPAQRIEKMWIHVRKILVTDNLRLCKLAKFVNILLWKLNLKRGITLLSRFSKRRVTMSFSYYLYLRRLYCTLESSSGLLNCPSNFSIRTPRRLC